MDLIILKISFLGLEGIPSVPFSLLLMCPEYSRSHHPVSAKEIAPGCPAPDSGLQNPKVLLKISGTLQEVFLQTLVTSLFAAGIS